MHGPEADGITVGAVWHDSRELGLGLRPSFGSTFANAYGVKNPESSKRSPKSKGACSHSTSLRVSSFLEPTRALSQGSQEHANSIYIRPTITRHVDWS
jgi:hypothetical protein